MSENACGVRNIRLIIAYNGKRYSGWQIQDNDRTIQGEIEKALFAIHRHAVKITGAGRTDSGVHARGQVANFKTDILSLPPEKYSLALNSLLPDDIRIIESREADLSFNSRYDARERVYKYYLADNFYLMPWEKDFSLYVNKTLDINSLNSMAAVLCGTHDFSAFSAPMKDKATKVRTIYSSAFYLEYPFVVFRISGSGFLRTMVRSIIGTIIELYKNGSGAEEFTDILNSLERKRSGPTAPARGLFLDSVFYGRGKMQ